MQLPASFIQRLHTQFDSEFDIARFLSSYEQAPQYGIRINRQKISVEDFIRISPFTLKKIPWTDDGFYIEENETPGLHPYYYAGLYYIQEPSAMIPAMLLQAQPGEKVLDLCAAPGGKTAKIAADMAGSGLLFANEINEKRTRALVRNVERCGIKNAIVLNETPQTLQKAFRNYFDKILIDAPCSGEGMFRKDKNAVKSWYQYSADNLCRVQKEVLHAAAQMLKPGGSMVYSTCTFSTEENEEIILDFLENHTDFILQDGHAFFSSDCNLSCGNLLDHSPKDALLRLELHKTIRLWPHLAAGEGHFAALLQKKQQAAQTSQEILQKVPEEAMSNVPAATANVLAAALNIQKATVPNIPEKSPITVPKDTAQSFPGKALPNVLKRAFPNTLDAAACKFFEATLQDPFAELQSYCFSHNGFLYDLPEALPDLSGLKIAKQGRLLGNVETTHKKGAPAASFEPSHSFLLSLSKEQFKNTIDLSPNDVRVEKYLKGETIETSEIKALEPLELKAPEKEIGAGLVAIAVNGFPLGFGKHQNQMIKNGYPKGWRKLK